MDATAIHQQARAMYQSLGNLALVEAAQKARQFEEQGAKDDARDWRRIEAALKLIQGPRET